MIIKITIVLIIIVTMVILIMVTEYLSVFSPNAGKYVSIKKKTTPNTDTFHPVGNRIKIDLLFTFLSRKRVSFLKDFLFKIKIVITILFIH